MNLTEQEKEELLLSYFNEKLLPISEKMREKEIELFPMSFDETAESYFQDRADDGNYVHEINFKETSSELEKILETENLPELAKLAESLVALAETLQEQEETNEEVSPFVYAMF